ncbi:SMP-30/gluconolactonase/LRE family protein [Rufibacter latericius]|uniref:T9SS C-terminal target domain-containing protein n=1 Tax=Rufibacter latericius TaxID=2487040 RepID=A0A3M9MAI0_9BACT|nr:SMP-30/gluconolactonase/LRE family protein [Rufibacter latericius]RNI22580.1 T9SS C-terminal target domain-containing protein [Rufibacter latericius]
MQSTTRNSILATKLWALVALLFTAVHVSSAQNYEYKSQIGSQAQGLAQFLSPRGVARDAQGNIYITDYTNNRVQKLNSQGGFLMNIGSPGSGNGQFAHPSAVAVDGQGNIFVTDLDNSRVQKFNAQGTFLLAFGNRGGESGQFIQPNGLALDAAGNVYVTDQFNSRVQKFNNQGVYQMKIGSNGTGDEQFQVTIAVALDQHGNIYIADYADFSGNSQVKKFSPEGTFLLKFGASGSEDGQFNIPSGLAVDGAGNVFVSDQNNHRIQKFSAEGNFLSKFGSFGTAEGQFRFASALTLDGQGNVYVADRDNNRVQKFNPEGTFVSLMGTNGAGEGQFAGGPIGIAVDGNGNLYVTEFGNLRVQKFNSQGSFVLKFGSPGSGNGQFSFPNSIAVDAAGNMYVTDQSNQRFQKFDAQGNFVFKVGSTRGSADGQFANPNGIALDQQGNIYVSDASNNRIQKFGPQGNFLSKFGTAGSGSGQFNFPVGIAVDAAGNIYVAEQNNFRVQKFSPQGTFLLKIGSQGTGDGKFVGPRAVAVDDAGNIFVVDGSGHNVQKFDAQGNFISRIGSQGMAMGQFQFPQGAAVDAQGNLFVTDQGSQRVQKFSPRQVTQAPVLDFIGNKEVNEGAPLSFTATAQGGASLTFSLAGIVQEGARIETQTGVFSWAPSEAQGPGTFSFTIKVSDGTQSDEEDITVTVNEVNQPPVIMPIGNKEVIAGQLLAFTANEIDADLPLQAVRWSVSSLPTGASLNEETGEFSWIPTSAQMGDHRMTFLATDGVETVQEEITIKVTTSNATPDLEPIPPQTATVGQVLTFTAKATDSNTDQQLSFSLVNAPSGAIIEPGSGIFTWAPGSNQAGSHTFQVRVTDNGFPALFAEKPVIVTVIAAQLQYTLTVTTPVNGSVTKSPDQPSYASGSTVTLTATPVAGYKFAGWSGSVTSTLTPLTVTMDGNKTVTAIFEAQTTGLQVLGFTLIDAQTNQPLGDIAENQVLNLAALPAQLNIRANTSFGAKSVEFKLEGPQKREWTDSNVPFALYGDTGGDYHNWAPAVGTYRLRARAYSQPDRRGNSSDRLERNFKVVNKPVALASVVTRRQVLQGLEPDQVEPVLYPNPTADGQVQVLLPSGWQDPIAYTLVSGSGRRLFHSEVSTSQSGGELRLDLGRQMPRPGIYFLHLTGKGTQASFKVVKE